jgi:phosphoglycolate phosphatase-like HAD superfamily hydrolase
MKGKSILLFDVDGTLVDTMDTFCDIAFDLLQHNQHIAADSIRSAYYKTSGHPFFIQLRLMIPEESFQNREKLAEEYERRKADMLANVHLSYETVTVLQQLKMKGYMLCISGSGRQSTVNSVFVQYKDLFSFILGYRPPHFHKGKAHIAYILQETQKQKDEVVYIGDSLNDALMAQQNGISFIAKLGSFTKTDFRRLSSTIRTIDRFEELNTIFGQVR